MLSFLEALSFFLISTYPNNSLLACLWAVFPVHVLALSVALLESVFFLPPFQRHMQIHRWHSAIVTPNYLREGQLICSNDLSFSSFYLPERYLHIPESYHDLKISWNGIFFFTWLGVHMVNHLQYKISVLDSSSEFFSNLFSASDGFFPFFTTFKGLQYLVIPPYESTYTLWLNNLLAHFLMN